MWRTGTFHVPGKQPVRSTLAHYYHSPLHVVTACGATPNGPLAAEDYEAVGARRCNACQKRARA